MAKPRRPGLEFAIYIAVRTVVCVIQALPVRYAFAFAEFLGWFAYKVDKRHRAVAAENLRHAFPDRAADPAAIDALVRACYRHFTGLLVEIILLPRKLHLENWRRYATLNGVYWTMPAFLDRRPLLVVTAHFGNWEMAGYTLGLFGFRMYAIARVLDNPHLERFLKQFRQATGQTIIAKKDDFERLNAALKVGAKVATLADQDAGSRGVFVNFFNRPASAHKAVALMALEYDARIVVVGAPRVGGYLQYEVVCEDLIDIRDYADRPDAVKLVTQRYHTALEQLIRRYPEQYFWLHRRWKTQPVARTKKASAVAADDSRRAA